MSSPTVVPTVTMYAGDTCVFPTYTFLTDTVPVDLSDFTFTAQWRLSRNHADAIELTVDATDSNIGVINILATAEDTALMEASGVFDLQGVRGAEVRTFISAPTSWSKDVTRG